MQFWVRDFQMREIIKNAGILTYVCIFLCTISRKDQAKTDFSLRSTAEGEGVVSFSLISLLFLYN